MYQFSAKSNKLLETCDPRLQQVARFAIRIGLIDITVVCGRRSKEAQEAVYRAGRSKKRWPESKHNVLDENELSKAVDLAPFVNGKVSWNTWHCVFLAGIVLTSARILSIPIRWGGNWDMDGEPVTDQTFNDLVHFEIVE